jgi:hypothetical protein
MDMNRDYPGEGNRETNTPMVPDGAGASACAGAGLPAWESFAVEDRQALVSALIHMARRRVPAPVPVHSGPLSAERG